MVLYSDDQAWSLVIPSQTLLWVLTLVWSTKGFDMTSFSIGITEASCSTTPNTGQKCSICGRRNKHCIIRWLDTWKTDGCFTRLGTVDGTSPTNGYTDLIRQTPNDYYIEKMRHSLEWRPSRSDIQFQRILHQKLKLNRARIYVQGQNLFTITKYTGPLIWYQLTR